MKIKEIVARTQQVLDVQPAALQRQARIKNVVSQIAASDQQQQPTELDKVMAMQQYSKMKKQANKNYANDLQQQIASVTPTRREKR